METDKDFLLGTAGLLAQARQVTRAGGSVTLAMPLQAAERLGRILRKIATNEHAPLLMSEVQWLKLRTAATGKTLKGRDRDAFLALMRFAEGALAAHAREAGAQEPVAWAEFTPEGNVRFWTADHARSVREHLRGRNLRPLYAHPAPAQEPVAADHSEAPPAESGEVERPEGMDDIACAAWYTATSADLDGLDIEGKYTAVAKAVLDAHAKALASHTPAPQPDQPVSDPYKLDAVAPQPGGAVKVKAMEWEEPSKMTNGCWVAKSAIGTYVVGFDDGWHACLEVGLSWEWEPENDPRCYDGPLAAQAACLEHLRQVGLGILEPSPSGWNAGAWQPTHRHGKRGSTYRVIGEAEAQVSTGGKVVDSINAEKVGKFCRDLYDGLRLTVYQGADGKLWVRFTDEFSDGRFQPLPTPPAGEG